jgi:hypothetical protein
MKGLGSMNSMYSFKSSISGSTTSSMPFLKVIKDFKKSLGERHTPRRIIVFNRIIIGIVLILIALQGIDFSRLLEEVEAMNKENYLNLKSERRVIDQVMLAVNARSYINVVNGLEFNHYQLP